MIELDVHVLKMDYTPEDVWKTCIDSLHVAKERAGYPVHIHVTAGIFGHLGASRKKGYSIGMADYATHVDDDDWVEPDAFKVLRPYLEKKVECITTGENLISEGNVVPTKDSKHHLAVFSREVLDSVTYEAFKYFPDQYLLSMVEPLHIDQCMYNHRISMDSGSRRVRRSNSADADRELKIIRRPDLAVVENATAAEIAAANDYLLRGDS